MSASGTNPPTDTAGRTADPQSALFTGLVLQQTQMALMFLGQISHPEKGEPIQDLEGASLFIDTLEMLEAKTKGNLKPEEEAMLRQSLMSVRMAFVEASRTSAASRARAPAPTGQPPPAPASGKAESPKADDAASEPPAAAPSDDEVRKKFVKKY